MKVSANRPAFDHVTSFYPFLALRQRDYGAYGVDYNTLAASAPGQEASFNVDRDSDFVVLSLSFVMTAAADGAAEQTFPEVLIDVRDSGSGQSWFNQRQHMANIFQRMAVDGHGPFVLPVPRFVPAGSAVTTILQNMEANARRVWLTFHGQKCYRGLPPVRD